jgi:D-serine deaminase-like pyridoxal phosphate-dependent protein
VSASPPSGIDELETPAVLVDLDRLQRNIDRMATVAADAGVDLRPHVKTHKTPQIARMQVEAGSRGITVAKVGEAEVMVDAGLTDIFIAYPILGRSKLERLCRLARRADIRVAADSWEVVSGLSTAATEWGVTLKVRLEIDTGMGRCGLQSPAEAVALAERMAGLPGVELCGIMGFSGQSYAAASTEEVAAIAEDEGAQMHAVARELRAAGFEADEISVGSTPTSVYAGLMGGVSEVRPGTYVFSDRTMVALGTARVEDCALTVLTTVVSRPTPARVILDVGTKGLTSDMSPLPGHGFAPDHPELQLIALTEEHGIAQVPEGYDLPIGTRIRVVPNHACGTANMFDQMHIIRGEQVIDRWSVAARGKMQ